MGAASLSGVGATVDIGMAEWGLEPESGDACVAQAFPGGVLMAVLDGVGHGPEAARAAQAAVAVLRAEPSSEPERLLSACHEALHGTRGAVASVALLRDTGTMCWAGVGNVQGAVVRAAGGLAPEALTVLGGVLGHSLPRVRSSELRLRPGDHVVFTTDGVRPDSVSALDPCAEPQTNAIRILAAGATRRDDALVLVARYGGAMR
jgi:hypothetical protein